MAIFRLGTRAKPQALLRPLARPGSERPEDVRDDGIACKVCPFALLALSGLLRRVDQVVLEHGVDGRVAGLDVLRVRLEGGDFGVQQVGALQLEHRQVAAACDAAGRLGRKGGKGRVPARSGYVCWDWPCMVQKCFAQFWQSLRVCLLSFGLRERLRARHHVARGPQAGERHGRCRHMMHTGGAGMQRCSGLNSGRCSVFNAGCIAVRPPLPRRRLARRSR